MTRKKNDSNRKKNNKVTVYLSDATRDYLFAEAQRPGMNRSSVVQDALLSHKSSTNKEEN